HLLFPGGLPTPFFFILAAIFVAWLLCFNEDLRLLSVMVSVVLVLGTLGLGVGKWFTYDILGSDHYLQTSTFKVTDVNAPPSLLAKYANNNQVEIPLEQADLAAEWVPRVAS